MEIHISNELDDENGKEREWKSSKGHGESERVCTRERESLWVSHAKAGLSARLFGVKHVKQKLL